MRQTTGPCPIEDRADQARRFRVPTDPARGLDVLGARLRLAGDDHQAEPAHVHADPAYVLWVRTESDRKGYSYDTFLKDWGPAGDHRDVSDFRISKSRSCDNGVILTVNLGKHQEKLWVKRDDLTIGFSPFPGCPAPR